MTEKILPPAARPCGSCPYRRDVPSGVWDESEYDKLAAFDGETWDQPSAVFLCHQQDGRLCAGWCGCHDMNENLGLRIVVARGWLDPADFDDVLAYATDVPLFGSGAEAAEHGRAQIEAPPPAAVQIATKLRKRGRG